MTDCLRLSVLLVGLGFAGSGLCDARDNATQALPDSAEARFEFLDANRDGVLSRYEYDSEVAFETVDSDRNTLISAEELQQILGPPLPGVPTAAVPGIVATATYAFLLCWSEYLFAVAILTQDELKTMPLALYLYFGENVTEWGNVMAASALSTIPTLLMFLPLQTQMVSGLAAGSVKQ